MVLTHRQQGSPAGGAVRGWETICETAALSRQGVATATYNPALREGPPELFDGNKR